MGKLTVMVRLLFEFELINKGLFNFSCSSLAFSLSIWVLSREITEIERIICGFVVVLRKFRLDLCPLSGVKGFCDW